LVSSWFILRRHECPTAVTSGIKIAQRFRLLRAIPIE
jgi:hypothetical protein